MKKILSIFMAIIVFLIIIATVTAENLVNEVNTVFSEEIEMPQEEIEIDLSTIIEQEDDIFEPEIVETPEPASAPSSITVTKKVLGEIWHIRCDVMDTTTFQSGGGYWKADLINNQENKTSKEGHRSNHCGNDDNWIIWVGTDGKPYRMDEIKSGATGSTLTTVVYRTINELDGLDIQNASPTDGEFVSLFRENYVEPVPFEEIQIGKRLYWTTQSGSQIWHHSGIPYKSVPNFMIFIDGAGYPLVAGQSVTIPDLLPGIYEISESPDSNYYLGAVDTNVGTVTENGDWIINIEIPEGEDVEIDWINAVKTPEPRPSPKPPAVPTVIPTTEPTKTPLSTPIPTIAPTDIPTIEPTSISTIEPTAIPSPIPTVEPTSIPSATPTATIIVEFTPIPSPDPTIEPSSTPIITASLPPTSAPIITPTPTLTPVPTTMPTIEPTISPNPTSTIPISTIKPTFGPTITPSPAPTLIPTSIPTSIPTVEPTRVPTPTITQAPTIKPTPTERIPEILSSSPTPTLTPILTPHPTLTSEKYEQIVEYMQIHYLERTYSPFNTLTEEELEKLIELFDYKTPLYGMLQTGDDIPLHILILILIGIGCIIIYVILKRYNS